MIVPIHGLKYHQFIRPTIDDIITLVKEKDNPFDELAVAAYNSKKEKIGYVSAKSCYNKKVYDKMSNDIFLGKVWAVFPNQILVELDFQKILPQTNKINKSIQNYACTSPV